jgi:hypothetical protein
MHNQGEYEPLLNEIFTEIDTKNCPNCNANSYVSKFPLHRLFFTLVSRFGKFGCLVEVIPPLNPSICDCIVDKCVRFFLTEGQQQQ